MTDFSFKEKANTIWAVANILRGDYKQSDYGKVILPMTVLRRLDCKLSHTKQKVLDYFTKVEKLSDSAKDEELMKEGQRDANRFWEKMSHSLGNKRKYIPENGDEKGIGLISKIYGDFEENEFSKIFPNKFFGYRRVTIEQPLKDEDGNIETDRSGQTKVDSNLRDYENIPFLRKDGNGNLIEQTIEEYFEREVKPHLPDAWIDYNKSKTGYEINFTKYFYEFKPLRSLAEIKADILALEEKTFELEKTILE